MSASTNFLNCNTGCHCQNSFTLSKTYIFYKFIPSWIYFLDFSPRSDSADDTAATGKARHTHTRGAGKICNSTNISLYLRHDARYDMNKVRMER